VRSRDALQRRTDASLSEVPRLAGISRGRFANACRNSGNPRIAGVLELHVARKTAPDIAFGRGIVIAPQRGTPDDAIEGQARLTLTLWEPSMVDREKIVAVLKKRFAGAGADQIAAAANAIVGLEDEWEELTTAETRSCSVTCYLAAESAAGSRFKVFQRRGTE
jgi:hypothetical protein